MTDVATALKAAKEVIDRAGRAITAAADLITALTAKCDRLAAEVERLKRWAVDNPDALPALHRDLAEERQRLTEKCESLQNAATRYCDQRDAAIARATALEKKWHEVLESEHVLSQSYVRIRTIIGAMDPPGTEPEKLFPYVESMAKFLSDRATKVDDLLREADDVLHRNFVAASAPVRVRIKTALTTSLMPRTAPDDYSKAIALLKGIADPENCGSCSAVELHTLDGETWLKQVREFLKELK